jgi:VCBS repeat-containing protein
MSDGDRTVTFTPSSALAGASEYTVTVSGKQSAGGDIQQVGVVFTFTTVSTEPPNSAPVATDDEYSTDEDASLEVDAPGVLANDTDADEDSLSASVVDGPQHGSLTLDADGSFSYTPDAGFFGTDTFTYRASDGDAVSAAATVTITVTEVPPTPQEVHEDVLAELRSLLPTGDAKADRRLRRAVVELEKSLRPELWTAPDALDPRHGQKVFDADRAAIGALTSSELAGNSAVAALLEDLLGAVRALAQAAIDDAVAAGGRPRDLSRAMDELARGDSEVARGRFEQAVDRFKAAWESALKSTR